MILLNSELHERLKHSLAEAESTNNSDQWAKLLALNPMSDGLLALLDFGLDRPFFNNVVSTKDINSWFLRVREWRETAVLDASLSPSSLETASLVLFALWENVSSTTRKLLRDAKTHNPTLPDEGGVLMFLGGLSKCLVIGYRILSGSPDLSVEAVVNNPKSVFDFWEAADHVDPHRRNQLKRILGTGHKIVVHRGIIVPIDRNLDSQVFGPTIDTLVLAELLAQQVLEFAHQQYSYALEVGCGNGLLTAALAHHCDSLKELAAIDTNFGAVSRTTKNVLSSSDYLARQDPPTTYFICGPFNPSLLARKFDLVVCNPPYIPVVPGVKIYDRSRSDFYPAVGGTDLMRVVLEALPEILNRDGKLLIMTSSLSTDDFRRFLPSGFKAEAAVAGGIRVRFDVEAAIKDSTWLTFLETEKGLTREVDGTYSHVLHPFWVHRG